MENTYKKEDLIFTDTSDNIDNKATERVVDYIVKNAKI